MSPKAEGVRRRILIVRTSALGDIVQSIPALTTLRRRQPEARIAWAIDARFRSLLEGHADLDELISIRTRAPSKGRPGALGVWQKARKRLRAFAPDTALDLMGNWKSAALCRLSGAGVRIGLAREFRREPASAMLLNEFVEPRGEHAVLRSLAPAESEALGGEPPTEDVDFAGNRLLDAGALPLGWPEGRIGRAGFFVIHPGAGWANKEYPPTWWGAVAHHAHEATGAMALAVTGPGEEHLGEALAEASQGAALHLPVPELPAVAAIHRQARLVLGGDTGPVHLAHALGTPVLCLMGPTDPARHGPWQSPDSVFTRALPCSYCHKRLHRPRMCLLQLGPDEVAAAAIERFR